MNPIYAPFHQIAYVTTDMTRALELMREDMGIPSFLLRDHDVEAIVGGRRGRMRMQLALANLDGVQIELIADHGSDFDIYTESLPKDGSFGLVFHHFCNLIPGGIEWGKSSLELFIHNAFDERANDFRWTQCAVNGFDHNPACGLNPYYMINAPRTVGLKFGQRF